VGIRAYNVCAQKMSKEKNNIRGMSGDFLREASVLLLVFGIIEPYARNRLDPETTWWVAVLVIVFFVIGVVLEKQK